MTEAQAKFVKRTATFPEKRHKYPGYLGHGSCVAFRVGAVSTTEDPVADAVSLAVPTTEHTNNSPEQTTDVHHMTASGASSPAVTHQATNTSTTTTTTATTNAISTEGESGNVEKVEPEKSKIVLSLASGRSKAISMSGVSAEKTGPPSKSPRNRRVGTIDSH